MTASNVRVQGNSSLYLTQIYYSVFDQSEQGLPLDAHCSAFCWLAFFLSIEDVLSLSCPVRHDENCLLELYTQEDRVLSEWKMNKETHRTCDPIHTLTNSGVVYHDYDGMTVY